MRQRADCRMLSSDMEGQLRFGIFSDSGLTPTTASRVPAGNLKAGCRRVHSVLEIAGQIFIAWLRDAEVLRLRQHLIIRRRNVPKMTEACIRVIMSQHVCWRRRDALPRSSACSAMSRHAELRPMSPILGVK